jgi:PKD repeat protein
MSLRTLGSGLSSCLVMAALLGGCLSAEENVDGASAPSVQVATQQLTDLPPHAAFSVVCIDRTCFPDAEASSDDVFIANYSWRWGDGAATSGSNASAPSHTYAAYGSFTIFLGVTDSAGQTSNASQRVTLIPPPTVAFTVSCSGRTCTGDASGSSSPVGIASYHWDWDDETTTDTTASTAVHTFAFGATFLVHLTVTDANGLSAGITHAVVVL